MGANDQSEQTSEGAGHQASAIPHAHRAAAPGRSEQDIARMTGKRAELATLQAQLRAARERGDIEQERAAATKLARRLVDLGIQLDHATRLARRSLLLGEDPKLREELSSWFASLGRLALAAGTLEPLLDRQLSGADRARLWTRIAVLRARASEAEASAEALNRAAKANRTDPLPLELYAAMRAFAPQAVSQNQATDALIVAANLRDASGDERAGLEDLLQALNVNPGHLPAAERMARHLTAVTRPQAADEVWRRAASSLPPRDERTSNVHRRRIREALDAQLPAVALGAALDLEADRELSAESLTDALDLINDGAGFVPIPTFDGLLHCLGLTDWLLARALRVARRSSPEVCADLTIHCARVLSGPLGQRDQLPWLLSECLLQAPAADAVFAALSDYASTIGDLSCVVDTIVALGRLRMDHPATHRRLEQLAFLSEGELRDPSAGVWALQVLAARAPLSGDLADLMHRLSSRVEPIDVPELGDWKNVSLPELRRLIEVLGQRPQLADAYTAALTEMCERDPEGLRWFRLRERHLWSQGLETELQHMWRRELARGRLDGGLCRLGLLRSFRRASQDELVLQLMADGVTEPALEEAAHYVAAAGELGSDSDRMTALELLAESAKPAVASVLWAYVSGLLLRRGSGDQAVQAAERACRADQQSARAFVACADALGEADTRVAGLVFERASRMVLPRVGWCRSLARIAELQGNAGQQLKWLRRWASLAPLDTNAASALLLELARGSDAQPLEAALDWLLGQPRPRQELLLPVCEATLRLIDLAPDAVGGVARRLIGVFGLADERLVQALRTVAERTNDYHLSIAVIERQLVFAAGAKEQIALLLEAADLRAKGGEPELAVDCLVRALALGASPVELTRRLDTLQPRSTSDAYLQELSIRVAQARLDATADPETVLALEFELALGYRDLASDRNHALAWLTPTSWAQTAEQAQQAFDRWVLLLGLPDAARHLQRDVSSQPATVKQVWLRAASLKALAEGEKTTAVELAFAALRAAPLQTDLLAVLESAIPTAETEELERAYQLVQAGVLGAYGERALHYRAACEFERRGDRRRALEHAESAFLAIPGHSIAFALMSRLADALGRPERVGEVMREASEVAPNTEQREYWLGHASSVAEDRVAELRERVDLLLRALAVRADAAAVRQVSALCSEIFEHAPEQRARLRDSFDTAIRVALRGADGSSAAATALAAAEFAGGPLSDARLALEYLALAIELDATHPELAPRIDENAALNTARARVILEPVVRAFEAGKSIHVELLRLCRQLAETDRTSLPAIAVALAVAKPQDVELLANARKVACNDPALLRRLEEAVPPLERAMAILKDVEAVEGPANQASRLDASVRRLASDTEWFAPVFECLRRLADDVDARQQVEITLEYLVNQEDIAGAQRAEAARLWAELLTQRDNHVAALEVLGRLAQWRQMTAADQRWGAAVAQLAGDEEQELAFLGQWELRDKTDGGRATSTEERVAVLARIAELHAAMGSRMQARHYYDRVLFLSPGHETAERFLIDDAERTEDYSVVAARLEEQLVASQGEPAVALKLCQVYVQRLRTPDRARAALEQALRLYGDDEELLCALAELQDSLGQDAAAAATYQKASRGSRQHHRASHYAELACRSYLRAGLDDSVKEILSVKGLYPNTQALAEMRVELARKQGNSDDIIVALEELAVVSKESAVTRAQCLLEASETALHQLRDLDRALALAERGARMAPSHLPLQLFARMLQYRKRGVGSRQDALYTITELRSIAPSRGSEPVRSDPAEWTEPAQAEVRVFLLAEALAKRSGAGAGLKELREVEKSFGPLPLVDLAIGERLSASDVSSEREEALNYLERALSGDFRELRSRNQVALDAAMLALKLGHTERGLALALRVDTQSEFGTAAKELVASIEASHPVVVKRVLGVDSPAVSQKAAVPVARVALKQVPVSIVQQTVDNEPALAERHAPNQRVEPTVDVEAVLGERVHVAEGAGAEDVQFKPEPELATDALSVGQGEAALNASQAASTSDGELATHAIEHALGGSAVPELLAPSNHRSVTDISSYQVLASHSVVSDPFAAAKDELQRLESQPPPVVGSSRLPLQGRAVPPPKPGQHKPVSSKALQAKAPPKRKPEPQLPVPSVVVSRSVVIGPDPRQPRVDPLSQPPPSAQRSLAPNTEVERGLMTALTAGSVGAGSELLELLKKDASRTRETLAACRLLAHWAPGDEQILAQLREAAQKDNDPVFARALLHAQRVLRQPERSPAAPPLHRQSEHVDSMIKLLAGPIQAGCEALGVLWQHLPDLFRQDPPELNSERRVDLGGGSALGELILELGRLFGCARVAIYETKQPGPVEFELVLAQPAALVIKGDVNPDSPHFRYQLGRMLFATRPEYALIVGLESDELHTVLGAIGVGFGPPRPLSGDVSQIAHLAERFWELLPPQVQRKLGELCEQPHVLEPDWVQEGARRALNRAGLFACGDLGVAIREVASVDGIVVVDKSLKALCEESESIADLVRFATSLEYADARWRSGSARSSTDDLGVRAQ